MVSSESNMKVAQDIMRAINEKDMGAFKRLHADGVTAWNPFNPEPSKGLEAHTKEMEGLWRAFPDLKVEATRIFGEGDWLCAEYAFTGTHKGPLTGPTGEIPATGKSLRMEVLGVMKVVNGKITEEKDFFDTATMAKQLGLSAE